MPAGDALDATVSASDPPSTAHHAGPLLEVSNLACAYGTRLILEGISLQVGAGEMVALLGRNGCGKSTLIRCLGGALVPRSGTVYLQGLPFAQRDRRESARLLAVVPQELRVPFSMTVREVVELGRAPHTRFLQPPSTRDRAAVDKALAATDLGDLAARTFQQISGGEQQRVALAMALAQDPSVLLLDEPTVHLDIAHQLAVLAAVRRLCIERGLAVLAAIHDINLAALYFDRLLVLGHGRLLATGTPDVVLAPALIDQAFGVHVAVTRHPVLDVPQVSLLRPT